MDPVLNLIEPVRVSGLYLGICLIISTLLSINVVRNRARYKVDMLHGDNIDVLKAMRVHGNHIEYAPYALLGLMALELSGLSNAWLHGIGATLVTGRLLHAYGIYSSTGVTFGRVAGMSLTWLVGLVIAVWLVVRAF